MFLLPENKPFTHTEGADPLPSQRRVSTEAQNKQSKHRLQRFNDFNAEGG